MSPTNHSVVEYGVNTGVLDKTVIGHSTTFIDGGAEKHTQYIHRVLLTKLIPGKHYKYHCGCAEGWSAVYSFTAMPSETNWSPRFAVYGDLGNVNAQSLGALQKETQKGFYDVILHVGDFAYDFDFNNSRTGDEFMRQIEPIAAYIPYMVCPGNHEKAYNFSHYKNRFSMPNFENSLNQWYSWNIGPAHIISFSTEVYFFINYGFEQIINQWNWLINDLKEATKPENRAKRPWIITMGHRPMYCSNNDHDDCTRFESIIRTGYFGKYGLEDLFYKYGVDLEFWAHEHTYERLWPVYNLTVYNGSVDAPYTNPKAPVHIITGSAGCREDHDGFQPPYRPWSAFRSQDYGYTRMQILNNTHLYMEQVSDDKKGEVIDKIMLIKDKHEPYSGRKV
ncbi:acid phosphatase type 7-like [Saccoglossus kowalevskii]|uniref:Purple acid phosphatase n=1 Tax=Saccoglossus kowalevskii TaxID=10224 RepID=A0ABM0M0S5_SACKO|nr:PREDICTED: iron/zinc purple acid phosphatase-like protein-like [Saccoglossus kowalevskii]